MSRGKLCTFRVTQVKPSAWPVPNIQVSCIVCCLENAFHRSRVMLYMSVGQRKLDNLSLSRWVTYVIFLSCAFWTKRTITDERSLNY